MFDLYKRRMAYTMGTSPSEAMRKAHDDVIDDSFVYDVAYKRCKINGEYVDAKFQLGSTTDVDDDKPYYRLQFRPSYNCKIGTIVDIPEDKYVESDYEWWEHREADPINRGCYIDEDGIHYRRWVIVDIPRDVQEQRYYIEECDWCLNWIALDKDGVRRRYKQLGAMRIRNSYSSGIYEKYYLTQIESQDAIWLPTNNITKTLYYDQRFLISDNELHPQAYKLSGVYTNHPVGMTKLILTQVVLEDEDDYENMLAGGKCPYYEADEIIVPEISIPDETQLFYLTGSNDADDIIYFDNVITFTVKVTEPSNDSLKHDYDYKWSYTPLDSDERSDKYFNDTYITENVINETNEESNYTIEIPYYTRLNNKHIRVQCDVTCVNNGEVKSFIWENLPLKRM